jgi:hypothetical protein
MELDVSKPINLGTAKNKINVQFVVIVKISAVRPVRVNEKENVFV